MLTVLFGHRLKEARPSKEAQLMKEQTVLGVLPKGLTIRIPEQRLAYSWEKSLGALQANAGHGGHITASNLLYALNGHGLIDISNLG